MSRAILTDACIQAMPTSMAARPIRGHRHRPRMPGSASLRFSAPHTPPQLRDVPVIVGGRHPGRCRGVLLCRTMLISPKQWIAVQGFDYFHTKTGALG